jgi:tetratricopeptide (TPR) repeat protein
LRDRPTLFRETIEDRMVGLRGSLTVVAAALLSSAPLAAQVEPPPAVPAGDEAAARLHYEKGTAAYALGDFAEAARQYETAFRLKLDPALLFNAAQAHRLAGNRQRAIELYENLLRVFPTARGRELAQQHLNDLRKLGAADPDPSARAAVGPAAQPPPLVLGTSIPQPGDRVEATPPLYKKTWFWLTVGGLLAAGLVTVAVVSAGDKPARPSWGRVGGP